MEAVPRGANFARIKMLWEIGVHVAAAPSARATNNREICIMVGNGSGDKFSPSLRMATGSPLLAYDVARGELDLSIMNPSAKVVRGFPNPTIMPTFQGMLSEENVMQLVAYIKSLKPSAPAR